MGLITAIIRRGSEVIGRAEDGRDAFRRRTGECGGTGSRSGERFAPALHFGDVVVLQRSLQRVPRVSLPQVLVVALHKLRILLRLYGVVGKTRVSARLPAVVAVSATTENVEVFARKNFQIVRKLAAVKCAASLHVVLAYLFLGVFLVFQLSYDVRRCY